MDANRLKARPRIRKRLAAVQLERVAHAGLRAVHEAMVNAVARTGQPMADCSAVCFDSDVDAARLWSPNAELDSVVAHRRAQFHVFTSVSDPFEQGYGKRGENPAELEFVRIRGVEL